MIRFIKGGASIGYAHAEGSEVSLSEAVEAELVETKFAVYVDDVKIEKAVVTKKAEKAVKK
jgi:hypothetical protein